MIITPKNKPFSQEMNLKIPPLSQGLKLSNYKPGCKLLALHVFVKYKKPLAFLHWTHSGKCNV